MIENSVVLRAILDTVVKPVWPLVLDSKVVNPKVNDDTVTLDTRGVVTRVCEYSGIRAQ